MKLFISTAILLFSVPVYAQSVSSKQVICMVPAEIIKALSSDDIQEKVFWAGKSDADDSKYALFVNSKTKKWTFIQLNEKMACILGTGDQSTLLHEYQAIKK